MKIHFICSGNTFRSRMAAAYLDSLKTNLKASSSGIHADHNLNGVVTWYAQRIFTYHDLLEFDKSKWDKTSKKMLNEADFVIFINDNHLDFCRQELGFTNDNYEMWGIKDLNEMGFDLHNQSLHRDMERIQASDMVFEQIKKRVDKLVEKYGNS